MRRPPKPKRDRVYILPTRYGLLFLTATVVMTLAGSAYQNNLVNMVAYFMLSLTFAAAVATHNNVKDISVEAVEAAGGFAGGEIVVTTTLSNPATEPRYNLEVRLRRLKMKSVYESRSALAPRGLLKLQASYPVSRRGRHAARDTRLSSVYPLGLFEAWKIVSEETPYLVYPRLAGSRALPLRETEGGERLTPKPGGGDDFHGHRPFRPGDPQRHVDWKAVARGRPRLIKEFNEGAQGTVVFDWRDVVHLAYEERLEQLAVWIDEARERKLNFVLKLPNQEINAGSGPSHAHRCWRALADFPAEGA